MKKTAAVISCLLAAALVGCAAAPASSSTASSAAPSVVPVPSTAVSVAESISAAAPAPVPTAAQGVLDEELAVRVYCRVFDEDYSLFTPDYRAKIDLVFTQVTQSYGVFTGNRGGATTIVRVGNSATAIDTGSMGDISFVKIVDITADQVVYDSSSEKPSTGTYTLDEELAARIYAAAYGEDPEAFTAETMKGVDYEFTQVSANHMMLTGNRGGGWAVVLVGIGGTVVDFGSMGDVTLAKVVDVTANALMYESVIER